MIPGFDAGVQWMKLWETKTINIAFMQGYWARDEKKLLVMDMTDQFKDYKKWDDIMTQYWPIKVYEVAGDKITFDTNHMLAGKDLIFDITIKDIK
jgi:FKBP-type peptidyl-prolyl cis-trans isomerase 2